MHTHSPVNFHSRKFLKAIFKQGPQEYQPWSPTPRGNMSQTRPTTLYLKLLVLKGQITHKTIASWNCYSLNLYKYTNQIPRTELLMNSTNPTNESRTPESRHHNVLQPAKLEFSNAYSRRTRKKKTYTRNKSTNPQAQAYFSLLSPAALELLAASNPILSFFFSFFILVPELALHRQKLNLPHKPRINENRVFNRVTQRGVGEKYTPSRNFAQREIATLFQICVDAQLKTQRKRIHETRTRSNKLAV
jgi:hypothetical protein